MQLNRQMYSAASLLQEFDLTPVTKQLLLHKKNYKTLIPYNDQKESPHAHIRFQRCNEHSLASNNIEAYTKLDTRF